MNAEKYHSSLHPVEEACRLTETGWVCLPNPLVGLGAEGRLLWKGCVLLRHALLVLRCWAACFHSHILVREFSTIPLLLVFPFLWPLRRKLFFVINHNLQWAVRSRTEHFGMASLARLGARWVLFETQEFPGLTAFNIPSERNLVLLHPVPGKAAGERTRARAVIGVAGYFRPEKGMDELLNLLAQHFPDCDIVIGATEPEKIKRVAETVQVINTASDADYRRMLAQCDVLVQNGARDSYFYRVSGPVADAAACGTAVVVPDFPLLRQQVSTPGLIGEVFQGLEKIPDAVRNAIAKARSGQYDFETYCAARTAQAVADRLDEFSREQHG
ncbi:MAG: hypothetical protein WCH86_06395 [Kiritimatiellales bacterium]